MFTRFSPAEKAVHFPPDRRVYIGLQLRVYVIIGVLLLLTMGVAWLQYLLYGLPADPSLSLSAPGPGDPAGFPVLICLTHWVNFFFLTLLVRSGLSILMDHPRLYWNNSCEPGSEWVRFTPLLVPKDKLWTAKEDARYISPLIGLPGYRHTVGIARCWHFLHVPFFLLNGLVFVVFLCCTNQWLRLVPVSWQILPDAWKVFVHYATLHMPEEPNGFYHYNALQQFSYFGVVFIFPPLAMLSGMAMSPAIENRWHWVPKLFGNRQGARSVHFLVMLGYVMFAVIHVSMIAATGLARNMNHITIGTDDPANPTGLYIGAGIIALFIFTCVAAHWISWRRPRMLQHAEAWLNGTLWKLSINQFRPKGYYKKEDISPYFWANGKLPDSEEWKGLAGNAFKDYRLKVGGLVDNPVELSLEELMKLGKEETITMHHCIQGWSGIAEWGGLPIKAIVDLVKPHAEVTTVVFYSFGEGLYGGVYYDTHTLDNCLKPASILAWEMNYQPLTAVYGAPLRLRVENQLGYKMVKWIRSIEFVASHTTVGKGYGGKNEDDEYFDLLANT
ncbi:DMSO/TMAO reductase YedYZ, molybdopterin-dependent catalytic subunit [Chitinophaga sp. YR627]|uniref:molybdopterin-dependent oxidoreductase n=1 Tax=Chitinophaga sp. YR627 TaxID=1881041 RepID=UPI0008F45A56|nr:molybdopterin-dependent oxidoreductase [Chitinophaga sp. YR627]SFO33545.1 DMSO/TMAO reductase YedYZ, molybdopterin-dependent catalytic subunit [Chitinophaga sp. YR627]